MATSDGKGLNNRGKRFYWADFYSSSGKGTGMGGPYRGKRNECEYVPPPPPDTYVHTANLFNPHQCERLMEEVKPDILVHLAWGLDNPDFRNSDTNFFWVENSLRLLHLFSAYGGQRFIFGSTGEVYGKSVGRFSENNTPIKQTKYGLGKATFEQIGSAFSQHIHLEFAAARFFSVYGENDKKIYRAIPGAIRAFANSQKFVCRTPNNVWDFVHVDDAANALVKIMASNYCGIVNVGTGKPHLMRNVFQEIAEKMGSQNLLSFDESGNDPTILVADPTILNNIIGYRCEVDFSEGINRTIAWLQTHKLI